MADTNPTSYVYAVMRTDYLEPGDSEGRVEFITVHATRESAKAAIDAHVQKMITSQELDNPNTNKNDDSTTVMVGLDDFHSFRVELTKEVLHDAPIAEQKPAAAAAKAKALPEAKGKANGTTANKGAKGKATKAAAKVEEEDDEDDEEDEEDEEEDQDDPSDVPQTLAGLHILVTGTLNDYNRKEAEAAITSRGGKFEKTLKKDLDYVVLGTKAGPKKLDEIRDSGIETVDGSTFEDFLANGPADAGKAKGKPATAANKGSKRAAPAAAEKKTVKKGKK